jgi:hypothetical protein
LGSVGTRCAQTADASLSDFGTGDVSPSTGAPRQKQLQLQLQLSLQLQLQLQLSLRGALVAARKGLVRYGCRVE